MPRNKAVNIRMPPELLTRIDKRAAKERRSRSNMIVRVLEALLTFDDGRAQGRQEVYAYLERTVKGIREVGDQKEREYTGCVDGPDDPGNQESFDSGLIAGVLEVMEDYPDRVWDETYRSALREDGTFDRERYGKSPLDVN